jgi:preprotein translocase subunit SecA
MLGMDWISLENSVLEFMITFFESNITKVDVQKVYMIFKEVYLHHLDKLWIEHLDEMQYLRDKV